MGVMVLLAAVVLDRERRRRAASRSPSCSPGVSRAAALVRVPPAHLRIRRLRPAGHGRPARAEPGRAAARRPCPAPAPAPAPAPPPPARALLFGTGLPEAITHRTAMPCRATSSRSSTPIPGVTSSARGGGVPAGDPRRAEPRLWSSLLAGMPLTFLAVAGWLAAAVLALRRPRATELLVVLGLLRRPSWDALLRRPLVRGRGGLREGHVRPHGGPVWALGFGLVVDGLWSRGPRLVAAATLAVVALALVACLEFGFA